MPVPDHSHAAGTRQPRHADPFIMSPRLLLVALTVSVAALLFAPQNSVAQNPKIVSGVSQGTLGEIEKAPVAPTADAIFARHIQAIGGKDAVLKAAALRTVGKMEMPAQGISAAMQSVAEPNRTAMKLTIPGIGEISNGFDGSVAWEVNPMRGSRIMTEKETLSAQESADFHATMLFAKERYSSVECVGQAEFGGQKTWQVKTVLKSGRVVNEYFSVETGLRVGSQTTSESQAGILNVSTVDSDYKQFGALKVATRTEMTTGAQKVVLTISDVIIGALPDSAFAAPASVKALIKP